MKVHIATLNRTVEINNEAWVPQKINNISPESFSAAKYGGGKILLENINDFDLKNELEMRKKEMNLPMIVGWTIQ